MISCRDGCKRMVEHPEGPSRDDEAAMQAGWTLLPVAGGWRCGACGRALEAAGQLIGPDGETADPLPPDSRGALPRETASTIAPPARGIA